MHTATVDDQYFVRYSWYVTILAAATGRSHCTKVGRSLSEDADLLSGVIQDSVIRPLMFLIFIDDCVLGVASFTIVLLVFFIFFYF